MKRNILTISLLALFAAGLYAQNEQDVLRYSFIQTGGTTRSLSMGGAIGAVGGDYAAANVNPAGLGIYRTGEFAFTGDYNTFSSKSWYLGEVMSDNGFKMGMSHFGLAMPLRFTREDSPVKGITFGVGYNKLKDYGQNVTIKAFNYTNSLVDGFVRSANETDGQWDAFGDGLAWETYLIDYDSITGSYFSDFDNSHYGQLQRRTINTRGSLGEYDFSMGINFSDKLFFGATLGLQKVNYSEVWEHSEEDPNNDINFFNAFTYKNSLNTSGSGANLKLGLLAKPLEYLRVGVSIQTPTALKLQDNYTSSMSTDLDDGQPVHKYDASGDYDYTVTTPFKATGSLAVIFKQYGLISVDYEFIDYSKGKLSSFDYNFFYENEAVTTRFKPTSNLRIGGELVLMSNYYVRGGFALYGNPYVSDEPNAGNNLNIYSAGVGYRDKQYYLDLGFAYSGWDQAYFLYGTNSADISNSQVRLQATVGFRF